MTEKLYGMWVCLRFSVMTLYLFNHNPELALLAENGLDPRQPLHTGEHFGRSDQHLARVEAIGLIKEKALRMRKKERGKGGESFTCG